MSNGRTTIEIGVGVGVALVVTVAVLTVMALDYDPSFQSGRSRAVLFGVAAVIGIASTLTHALARKLQGDKATYTRRR